LSLMAPSKRKRPVAGQPSTLVRLNSAFRYGVVAGLVDFDLTGVRGEWTVMTRLAAALVDVGGTLWPDRWPTLPGDQESSARLLCASFPDLSPGRAMDLVLALEEAGSALDGATEQAVDGYIGQTLRRAGLPSGLRETAAVLSGLCIPARGRVELFEHADELLRMLRQEGLRCAVVSNTVWRDNAAYWRDFEALGVAQFIDAVVSSVDLGYRKPHPAMFQAGAAEVGVALADCVVIGNSETLDVRPAEALGVRVVRVALEEPPPAGSDADQVASSLGEAADIVRWWSRSGAL
jgi:FMN phosphatase YigB (HAD superfamily)